MRYASIVPDIAARAIDGSFDYYVPAGLEQSCLVGTTVLVSFGRRDVVGYVIARTDEPADGVDASRVLPVKQVLAAPSFDQVGARLAEWMAREYAAPLALCLRLMLPPGQTMKVAREDGGSWQLVIERARAVDDRWVSLTESAEGFEPRANARRQLRVLEALEAGPQRMAELSALVPGASSVVSALLKRGVVSVEHRRRIRGSGDEGSSLSSASAPRPQRLTDGQRAALDAIAGAVGHERGDVVLVDGVTGSGKTEVYLDAIERVRAHGRSAIVLVPEISLTAQTVGRFRSRFGDDVAILHSRLSVGERFDQWDMARSGRAHVVVGARSALFAPLSNVGLIVVDEEHEGSYKQDQAPRYHAREAAAELARLRGAALVLGSATPSLESLERCRRGLWHDASWTRVEMPERPGGAVLPRVRVVDMKREFAAKNGSIFSRALRDALLGVAERREKAVLMLNRRGFASFLMCRECGCVPTCTHCSTSLTYHERTHSLVCHSCGRSWPVRAFPDPSTKCPNCGSRYLAQFGVGTQRVEDELRVLLEGAEVDVIRMDADTTATKGAHTKLLERFDASPCAVLVGTQMIAKGLDFPEVTLVGVVNADTTLKLPDFRAAERTYHLLEQVAGRAGRGERPGEVIVQTYWATHPAIQAVARHDRSLFERYELEQREEAYYPPYSRLANVTVTGVGESAVRERCKALADAVRDAVAGPESEGRRRVAAGAAGAAARGAEFTSGPAQTSLFASPQAAIPAPPEFAWPGVPELPDGWEVLGPAECVKARVKDRLRRHIVVKAPVEADLGPLLAHTAATLPQDRKVTVSIDIDAYDMM